MPLDASAVLSKVAGGHRGTLSPAQPVIVVDAGAAGASFASTSGSPLTATVDNAYAPGAWSAASNPTAIASGRRAFQYAGGDHVTYAVTWS